MCHYTNFFTIRCAEDHRLITEEFNNLEEAIQRVHLDMNYPFTGQHNNCGQVTIIAIHRMCHIMAKCTECPYIYKFSTNRKAKDIDTDLKNITHTWQRGLHIDLHNLNFGNAADQIANAARYQWWTQEYITQNTGTVIESNIA